VAAGHGHLQVVVTAADQLAHQAAIERLKTEDSRSPGDGTGGCPRPSHDGKVALVSFTMGGTQNDDANRAIVHQVRSQLDPSIFGSLPGVQTYVTGDAAASVDVTQVYTDGAPFIFVFVLGLSFLLMLVAFHSIVIPIKAIILNLLSTAAAYGVLVLVFQDGRFAGPLGITPSGVIESWVPLLILRSCSACRWTTTVHLPDQRRATAGRVARRRSPSLGHGWRHQHRLDHGRRVRGFVGLKFVFIQQIGLARGRRLPRRDGHPSPPAGVDDTPGDWNWWMPRFLDWIPRVTIRRPDEPVEAGPPAPPPDGIRDRRTDEPLPSDLDRRWPGCRRRGHISRRAG
jgi:RND superfamily putative drug exporter